jgi:arginase
MKLDQVRVFGIPMDLGQNRRGVDMGPSAMRYAQLHEKIQAFGYKCFDEGNILVSQAEESVESQGLMINAHYLPEVSQVCQRTFEMIHNCWRENDFGLFIGGDHSISIGTVAAVAERGNVGVLWVDAHTDMNTPESSPSGNIHGMSMAVLLGDGAEELVNVLIQWSAKGCAKVALQFTRCVTLMNRVSTQLHTASSNNLPISNVFM